jgi:membrane protein implicated in regulation of membrane protease activity
VDIKPKQISGKVQVENQTWSATARTEIPVGTDVVIVESRGVHVVVEPVVHRRD